MVHKPEQAVGTRGQVNHATTASVSRRDLLMLVSYPAHLSQTKGYGKAFGSQPTSGNVALIGGQPW